MNGIPRWDLRTFAAAAFAAVCIAAFAAVCIAADACLNPDEKFLPGTGRLEYGKIFEIEGASRGK
jgi:hypothetical protein